MAIPNHKVAAFEDFIRSPSEWCQRTLRLSRETGVAASETHSGAICSLLNPDARFSRLAPAITKPDCGAFQHPLRTVSHNVGTGPMSNSFPVDLRGGV